MVNQKERKNTGLNTYSAKSSFAHQIVDCKHALVWYELDLFVNILVP